MKVVLIGTGNVATVIGKKIQGVGYEITQVVGRSMAKATNLASILKSTALDNILKINRNSNIYIIAVSDSAVGDIAINLELIDKTVVHTAGSLSLDILKNTSSSYGVLYPLQSLRKEINHLPEIPILVDGNNDETIKTLTDFSRSWANAVSTCSDKERLKLHLAAVITSNFTNHLYTLTESYCKRENLNFNVLQPLIKETAERLEAVSPALLQTGPAVRGDVETIQRHELLLDGYPQLKSIYNMITESIISYHNV